MPPKAESTDEEEGKVSFSHLDKFLSHIGEFGLFQKLLFFSLAPACSSMAIAVYAFVFLEFRPDFQCQPQQPNNCSSHEEFWSLKLEDPKCQEVRYEDCQNIAKIAEPQIEDCQHFIFDKSVFQSTVVTEFEAVCSRSYLVELSTSTYMSGMLFGSFFFGWLSDVAGRKKCFATTVVFLSIGSLLSAVSISYPIYIVARFVTSMGGMGIFITAFVLVMEFVGPSYRTICGFGVEIPFALGEIYVGLLAYFIRDWRYLQTAIAAPFFLFFFYLCFIPESVRWALSKGRKELAKSTIDMMASVNKVEIPEGALDTLSCEVTEKNLGLWSLLSTSKLRPRLLIMSFNWVVTTLCYYGLTLSASLSQDVFTTFTVAAAMELPSYIFCMIFADRIGRKPILSLVQILASVACITAGFVDSFALRLVLTMVGKFGASASFAIVFVYTAELFPTPMRNSAVGICSTCARIGGILAPLVAGLGQRMAVQVPFLVMGVPAMLGGFLALMLPETAGQILPDTLDQAMKLEGGVSFCKKKKLPVEDEEATLTST